MWAFCVSRSGTLALYALQRFTTALKGDALSPKPVAVLIELVQGATGRPESMAEIIELSNDLRELTLV